MVEYRAKQKRLQLTFLTVFEKMHYSIKYKVQKYMHQILKSSVNLEIFFVFPSMGVPFGEFYGFT